MNNKLTILPLARDDVAQAFKWYEEQDDGLGVHFLQEMKRAFESIRHFPETYELIHASYRRALVRRFPYAVFFEFVSDEVLVYAVTHTSRHSRVWRKRIP